MNDFDLRSALSALGLTQQGFADHIGCSVRSVKRWMNVRPPLMVAKEVERMLAEHERTLAP